MVTGLPTDRILLTGLRVHAHHGVFAEERRDGQPFVIDLEVALDLAPAGGSDELGRTLHYGELADEVAAAAERDPVDLIETLAERVAGVVLAHPVARWVRVTVHKPDAPIAVPFDDVAVVIDRASTRPAPGETVRAVVAVGSNLGDRRATIERALALVDEVPGLRVVRSSDLVESVAVTPEGEDPTKPGYLNGVALVDSALGPHALLDALAGIERDLGRVRAERWGDRTIDLDVIAYGDARIHDERLTLPHPRAAERAFVLGPWLRADPDAELPGLGRVDALLAALEPAPAPAPAAAEARA
ncbi:2-amino-4-hydroxy-6-hydroxymethyldihydropteridine diphosphokinase [Clavibacter sp. VKM Ac-2542]|uniref:2-amino-4-hydroxy-6- hydroxymethyldihydropteridine diphosphokinase n=1 Tax=Clavibacter sp. VKM Ac-2542 TaxID=2783811 RepID=UPI001889E088|nr:2-amino-4-hydroxy-6-hydroxymethyldihydropteridine diphosphokinase [Clavibacter sp. VKM Ac-2542]MBF4620683.1 2-amino-4-hydroxy-6-hydroxymethyldihydropteridine diphosphokinase [Clavibacter sp. VKM Ac-2542]